MLRDTLHVTRRQQLNTSQVTPRRHGLDSRRRDAALL